MYRTIYGLRDYGAGEPECYVLREDVPEDERRAGIASMQAWLDERLSVDRCIDEIHAMRACVRVRQGEEGDIAHQMAIYAAKCQEYPAAAVLRAVRDWPNQSEFFPTWNALSAKMQLEANAVRRQIEALGRKEETQKTEKKGKGWKDMTEAEKEKHRQMMAGTKRKMAEGEAKVLGDSVRYVLSPKQMEKIEKAKEAFKAKSDADGHEANKQRLGFEASAPAREERKVSNG